MLSVLISQLPLLTGSHGAPAAEQMNGVLTELKRLGPLQQLLGRGMAGVIAAGCDRKQFPWQLVKLFSSSGCWWSS